MSRTVLDPSLTPSVQPNIIDNGGFEVWQRGTSFSNPASGTFTADRWYITKSGTPTINVTQNSTAANVDSGLYSLKFDITALGSGFGEAYVQTNVENPLAYASKTLTVSVRVKASVANLFRVTINDGSGFAVSSYHPGDGAFHTLSATFTPGSTPSQINVRIGVVVGDTIQVSTAYFDSVMLTFGSAVPSFIPINPKEDLERCQRYYQVATQSSAGGGLCGHLIVPLTPFQIFLGIDRDKTWYCRAKGQHYRIKIGS